MRHRKSSYGDAVTETFLFLARSSVILALIVVPMLEGWVPGHFSRVAPIYVQKCRGGGGDDKNRISSVKEPNDLKQ